MKRILLSTLFLAAFGLALAGPPVDYQLYCAVDNVVGDEPIGVASLVDDQLHVALIDGAFTECIESGGSVGGVIDGVIAFELTFDEEAGFLVEFSVTEPDELYEPATTSVEELPAVAIVGMLGAQQNRAEAFQRAEAGRAHAGGPPMDVPAEGDEGDIEEEAATAGEDGGPPMELPEPATRGRP